LLTLVYHYNTGPVCKDYIILYDADDIQLNNSNNNYYYKHASDFVIISIVSYKWFEDSLDLYCSLFLYNFNLSSKSAHAYLNECMLIIL